MYPKGIHMTISLQKRTEAAEASLVSLLKQQQANGIELGDLVAQVVIAIDFSGSMNSRYGSGEVQEAVERALALSLSGLDDDGTIQVFFFDSGSYKMESVTNQNYQGFVSSWASRHNMGGTNYASTIRDIVQFVGGKKKIFSRSTNMADESPVLVIFVTDGAPSDQEETKRELTNAAHLPIFWQFLGLGHVPFLKQLNKLPGRVVDNVGLTEMSTMTGVSDAAFFDSVIGEFFAEWLPEARRQGITRK
jgi:uncharacterized protein YegL